jgi:hypothetical protein
MILYIITTIIENSTNENLGKSTIIMGFSLGYNNDSVKSIFSEGEFSDESIWG